MSRSDYTFSQSTKVELEETELLIIAIEKSLNIFLESIGKIPIGTKELFPYGWGKAAKGRTVWRILEEIVIQNLKANAIKFGLSNIEFSNSETSVHDFKCQIDSQIIYVNIKSSVLGGIPSKDDISKPIGIKNFFQEDKERQLFIATFFIKFNEKTEMSIEIAKVRVFPITWIPDIYVNPSNNGNIQSSKYKSLDNAIRRTTDAFLELLDSEIAIAEEKKIKKSDKKKIKMLK